MRRMTSLTVFVLVVYSYSAAADTGSASVVDKAKCLLIDSELELLRKLLNQETAIRENNQKLLDQEKEINGYKMAISNLSNVVQGLHDNSSNFERNLNRLESSISIVETKERQLVDRLDVLVEFNNESMNFIKTEIEQMKTRTNWIDQQRSNDNPSFRRRISKDGNLSLCPANIIDSKGLVQTGYAMIDCTDIHQRYPQGRSGVYRIYPAGGSGHAAYCEMTVDGGGWTVFQRRKDGSEDFYRTWEEYKTGFGSVSEEHWLGNQALYELSIHCSTSCELRVDLEDFEGNRRYAKYTQFRIGSEEDGFQLHLGNYYGNAGDSLSYSNGAKFSTNDKDQDTHSNSCANLDNVLGAWWFKGCFYAHLNSVYHNSSSTGKDWFGLIWSGWKGSTYSLKATRMMVRRDHERK